MIKASEHSDIVERIEMDEATKNILKSADCVPMEINVRGRKFYPKEYKAEGFKGVVWYGNDEYNGEVAIKFTIFEDYMDRSYLEEAKYARDISNSEHFARFLEAGTTDLQMPNGTERKFIVFVEQWINGSTLPAFLATHTITSSFFLSYVRGMCKALGILRAKRYRHDDLRPNNVMLEEPEEGDIDQESKVKIIDTGSMKLASSPTKKEKDDYRWFAEHLLLIRNSLYHKKSLSIHEAQFIKQVDPLLDRMFEEDRVVALWLPSKVFAEFNSAWTRSQAPQEDPNMKLDSPFDYIAAEHISSDELLVKLFADTCPWFAEIASPNPVLVTGPRGCGKSMAFRRMSLKALLYKEPKEIQESQIAGFYISCSSDLRNRFSWLTSERAANRHRNGIIHYFNLLVAREIVQTLALIASRDDRESLFGFGPSEETIVHEFLMSHIQISEPEKIRLQGMGRMYHALGIIEQMMNECYVTMRKGVPISNTTDTPFIADLTNFLCDKISFFNDRKVALLIDDFSIHRISKQVQLILNSILWDRQGSYVSKVSAEKYGAEGIDELEATTEIARELREFDCGRYFLDANKSDTQRFAKDLLEIRLKLSDFAGTPDTLIGKSDYEKGGLGQELRVRNEEKGRKDNQYHGLNTIADLCSGDISNLLEIYRRIFEYGKVKSNTTDCVDAHIQHKAIQAVSRDLLELIKNYVPLGPEMHKIVYWFGTLSRRILREGREQKKGNEYIPSQTTRIEVDQPIGHSSDELAPPQQELIDELVRRTIFIEMEPGRSRHKFTPSLRWQLRRIYCPAFGTSIYKNTAVKWSPDEFKHFLLDPETLCNDEFKKRWSRSQSEIYQRQLVFSSNN